MNKWGSESRLDADLRRLADEVHRLRSELEQLTTRTARLAAAARLEKRDDNGPRARARKPLLRSPEPIKNERRARLLCPERRGRPLT